MALNALYYYAIGFIIIWVVALLFRDRLKIEIEGPIMMRRTKRLRDFIDAVAMKSPKSWRFILNIGIPVSFFFMILTLGLILYTLSSTFYEPTIIISTTRSGYSRFTGIYTIRLWYNRINYSFNSPRIWPWYHF